MARNGRRDGKIEYNESSSVADRGLKTETATQRSIGIGKRYRHFKGKEYLVLHVAKHSETLEDLVVYQALYGEKGIWVRPLDMFLGQTEKDGQLINRFEEIVE